MTKKVLIGLMTVTLLAVGIFFAVGLSKPQFSEAVTLFPKETMFYSGTRSPVKIAAALAAADIEQTLQEEAGLTEKESQVVCDWIRNLRGVHVGFNSFTLVPFVVDAAVVLEGPFDRPLTDILGVSLQRRMLDADAYRDVAVQKFIIPIREPVSLEMYITDPVEDRVIIAFSRRSLTDLIDRMLDGGSSLADNPRFLEMTSLKELRKTDILQYADVQAYLNLLYDWVKLVPQPQIKSLVDLFWKEFRLTDYECTVSGMDFFKQTQTSFLKLNPENPLAVQFTAGEPLRLPHVPVDSFQLNYCRLADPSLALGQMVETAVRLERGISGALGGAAGTPIRAWLQEISAAAEKHPSELGDLLTGEIGMWKRPSFGPRGKPAICVYVGIKDAEAVRETIGSITDLEIIESDGICRAKGMPNLAWRVQSDALLVANNADYLQSSLAQDEVSLTESAEFIALLKGLPKEYAILQYVNYENGIPIQNAGRVHAKVLSFLDLFKGFRQMSVSCAADGMLHSHTAQRFRADRQLLRAAAELLFSSAWAKPGPDEPEFLLSADEALKQSIELLSGGRQIEAEELLSSAVKVHADDDRVVMAKAVTDRSRWGNKSSAETWFKLLEKQAVGSYLSEVAKLQLELDQHKNADVNIKKLIQISGEHPDDMFLLWLSGIQCREQGKRKDVSSDFKLDVAKLGKAQYQKLLSKFRVGPVMVHYTYANILTEGLDDHETALEHYYKAVSMESGWTLEGLGGTLTELARYDEACAVWARAVQVRPRDAELWSNWGWTLRRMGQYEEALEKHLKVVTINATSVYDIHHAGYCLEMLKRYDEMIEYYRQGSEMNYAMSQHALGWCYEYGKGVGKDDEKAFELYFMAAEQDLAESQNKAGYFMETGRGVEADFERAAEWFRKASEQGHLTATGNLGLLYSKGKGVEFNPGKAISYYNQVLEADPDHAHTLNNYAWLMATCKDQSFRDYAKAVRLAERSVKLSEQFYSLDTLAVAYDRDKQYAKAVDAQKRLIEFRSRKNPGKEVPEWFLTRLGVYEQKAKEMAP